MSCDLRTNPTNGIRPHAVTQAGTNSYVYDANGNMTSGAGRTIAYNYDNMPSSITKSGITATFVYDYAGQRVKKTVSSVTTVYIGKLYECTSGVCTKYIFGGSNRIASKKSSTVYYYHTDHLGSSSIITNSTGSKVEEIYYYPYGGTRIDSGSISVKHKYTSQELDGETGLYNYGARYYDPVLARFISADTIVQDPTNPQALNRYTYVLNNPVIYIDPIGYSPIVWGEINGGGGSSSGNSITLQNYSYNPSYYYPGYYNYSYNQFRYDPFSESRDSFWDYYGNNSSRSGGSGNVVNPAAGQSGSNFGVGINMPVTVIGYVGNNPQNVIYPFSLKPPQHIYDGANTCQNIREAQIMGLMMNPLLPMPVRQLGLTAFVGSVWPGSRWDYKKYGREKYEAFGNYHFGVVAAAAGFSEFNTKLGAGLFQASSDLYKYGTIRYDWNTFFDQPEDQKWIIEGYRDYQAIKKKCECK